MLPSTLDDTDRADSGKPSLSSSASNLMALQQKNPTPKNSWIVEHLLKLTQWEMKIKLEVMTTIRFQEVRPIQ